ncbi:hypothetical protein STEG23_024620, partial [Scotinomys teguina]
KTNVVEELLLKLGEEEKVKGQDLTDHGVFSIVGTLLVMEIMAALSKRSFHQNVFPLEVLFSEKQRLYQHSDEIHLGEDSETSSSEERRSPEKMASRHMAHGLRLYLVPLHGDPWLTGNSTSSLHARLASSLFRTASLSPHPLPPTVPPS